MIVSELVPKQGICRLTVESPDDLWTLRRLLAPGDTVVTKSSRVLKREGDYSRPDKGERIKVTVALEVESIALDSSVARLRVRGRIVEASDESVTKAGSHSLLVSPGQELTIKKDAWRPGDTRLLEPSAASEQRFLLVAVDRREAGVGLLSGSHLTIVSTVESGASGKQGGSGKEVDMQPYFRKVLELLKATWREGDLTVVAGPGNTKLTVENLVRKDPDLRKKETLVEGFDLAGADGVRALVKFEGFRKVAKDSVLVEVQEAVDEAIRRISRGERRVAYTLPRVAEAGDAGAVEKCMVSDDVFAKNADEDALVVALNSIEDRGGKVFLVDSTLETGKQVSSLGGVVALLRYDVAGRPASIR
ncbi:MAG: pelota family protein [Nitrososphaerota archaeon]|nr:pelota family protein [Nitrososphaerota archaeon]MDG6966270.1 pelota family protein [Nitrososphaerota archaeon]MDG6977705.1 pelota family protein [Nitrososphaerota archaeon]MDG6980979.1 pelota family protein [Nitrososphaerota archaeon]